MQGRSGDRAQLVLPPRASQVIVPSSCFSGLLRASQGFSGDRAQLVLLRASQGFSGDRAQLVPRVRGGQGTHPPPGPTLA